MDEPISSLGATYLGEGRTRFLVWAPKVNRLAVQVIFPEKKLVELTRGADEYYSGVVDGVPPGARYFYRLDDNRRRPDPASRFQPMDVHGASQVVDRKFAWTDGGWRGRPITDYVIYELHIGTFTPEGTYLAAIEQLDDLVELGITALQIMPVAQCPGERNWGYDGVYQYAPAYAYGPPQDFKLLVDACHARGLAVVLDVVYNHLGPEGNYLGEYGHYFSQQHHTPWGPVINFDGPGSLEVRRYFLENALDWINEFHVDALRLDAVHAIIDHSPQHFLAELGEKVHARSKELDRPLYIIAESNRNDPVFVRSRESGGFGLDGQYLDDFPFSLHALMTGEQHKQYRDFSGPGYFAKAYREGFVLTGQYSHYRQGPHGQSSQEIPAEKFMVFSSNHDSVGNRPDGSRLSKLVGYEEQKLITGALLLSPYVPALFMGDEYGETAPFYYFVNHHSPELIENVRKGRKRELSFGRREPPDPAATVTFAASKLNRLLRDKPEHEQIWQMVRELLRIRRELPPIIQATRESSVISVDDSHQVITSRRWCDGVEMLLLLHFGDADLDFEVKLAPLSKWRKCFDSADSRWLGRGSLLPEIVEIPGNVKLSRKSCLLLAKLPR